MKLLLTIPLCALTACGGAKFDDGFSELSHTPDAGGDAQQVEAGSAGAAGDAGAGSAQVAGSAGLGGAGTSGQAGESGASGAGSTVGTSGAAGSSNCSPLSCRNVTTGDVYCGKLSNVCGDSLDCGTDCQGAGTCGTAGNPNMCSVMCKPPRCIDQRGLFTCGIQSNACGDQIDCGLAFACDGTELRWDGTRVLVYPNGRCGSIPDGCNTQDTGASDYISCSNPCPSGTYCDSNGVCQ